MLVKHTGLLIDLAIGRYVRVLHWAMNRRASTVGLVALVLVLVVGGLGPQLRREFFPEVDAGSFEIYVREETGTRIEVTEQQIAKISPEEGPRRGLRGGCMTAIVSPEGNHLVPPLTSGEGILVADLDMALIVKRKRMMDSVGHYARPELLSLLWDDRPAAPMH